MSNYILTDAFLADVATTAEMIVLVSLADQANDHGVCWPSNHVVHFRITTR